MKTEKRALFEMRKPLFKVCALVILVALLRQKLFIHSIQLATGPLWLELKVLEKVSALYFYNLLY